MSQANSNKYSYLLKPDCYVSIVTIPKKILTPYHTRVNIKKFKLSKFSTLGHNNLSHAYRDSG
jgi:hypothetical protein